MTGDDKVTCPGTQNRDMNARSGRSRYLRNELFESNSMLLVRFLHKLQQLFDRIRQIRLLDFYDTYPLHRLLHCEIFV